MKFTKVDFKVPKKICILNDRSRAEKSTFFDQMIEYTKHEENALDIKIIEKKSNSFCTKEGK